MVNAKLVVPAIELNREQQRLLKKRDLAADLGCSTRQVELMVNDGRLPKPFYIGTSSPRWRQSDIDAWLNKLATDAQRNAGGAQ
jgi:predicted DNA-binding transcriptional regulator AlpA